MSERCFIVLLTFAVVTTGAVGAQAQSSDAVLVLELGMGARALGMGGAFTALGGESAAVFYNPAALAGIRASSFAGYVARPFNTFDHLGLQLVVPSFGVGFAQYGISGIPVLNPWGNPTGRSDAYLSRAVVLGAGSALSQGFALGAALKLLAEQNGPFSGSGWGLDIGLGYQMGWAKVGLVAVNVLSDDIEVNNGNVIPQQPFLRGGVGATALIGDSASWHAALDGVWRGRSLEYQAGTELWLGPIGLRMGWHRGLWTAGASVRKADVAVHIAYAFHDVLPHTLRLSATMAF